MPPNVDPSKIPSGVDLRDGHGPRGFPLQVCGCVFQGVRSYGRFPVGFLSPKMGGDSKEPAPMSLQEKCSCAEVFENPLDEPPLDIPVERLE